MNRADRRPVYPLPRAAGFSPRDRSPLKLLAIFARRYKLLFPYTLLAIIAAIAMTSNMGGDDGGPPVSEMPLNVCPPCGMSVDPASAIRAERDGRAFHFCGELCRARFLESDRTEQLADSAGMSGSTIDVVCRMEVNPAWNYDATYGGGTYHFCTSQCRAAFEADPEHYLAEKCLVCADPLGDRAGFSATYLEKTYRLCSEEHRSEFKRDPAAFFMHTMWGIPPWLYYASIALVMVLSFGLFDFLGRRGCAAPQRDVPSSVDGEPRTAKGGMRSSAASEPRASARAESPFLRWVRSARGDLALLGNVTPNSPGNRTIELIQLRVSCAPAVETPVENRCHMPGPSAGSRCHTSEPPAGSRCHTDRAGRFDLLSIGWVRACLRSRVFRFALQAVVAALFVLIIAAGLFGNQNPALNIAPILTWTVWWGLLIVLIMFAGKAWCYVCPWDAIAGWTERLSLWQKSNDGLTLGMKWPRVVRNIWIATVLFVGLTWIELGFGVTMKPRVTAYLAIAMLLMAMVSALLFDRKSFCRYGCLVGRVSGLYALFAGTEVRSKNAAVCRSCRTKECVTGSRTAYGCPTYLYPGNLKTNTYCIQCMECVQACPHGNLAVNLRPWGSDLELEGKPRSDEAYLALLMLAITGFHGLTMTPVWQQLIDGIRAAAGIEIGRASCRERV